MNCGSASPYGVSASRVRRKGSATSWSVNAPRMVSKGVGFRLVRAIDSFCAAQRPRAKLPGGSERKWARPTSHQHNPELQLRRVLLLAYRQWLLPEQPWPQPFLAFRPGPTPASEDVNSTSPGCPRFWGQRPCISMKRYRIGPRTISWCK